MYQVPPQIPAHPVAPVLAPQQLVAVPPADPQAASPGTAIDKDCITVAVTVAVPVQLIFLAA